MSLEVDDVDVAGEVDRLLSFAVGSRTDAGFGALDASGRLVAGAPAELWISCRMTHVFGLAAMIDPAWSDAPGLLDHGVETLLGTWQDARFGGWFASVDAQTGGVVNERKDAYAHAFVLLAGATATSAGHPSGRLLHDRALEVLTGRFWEDAPGMVADSWDRSFGTCDSYRGLNANMHAVEALLASHDVTGESWPLVAATRIAERVCDVLGPDFGWRLPEHFNSDWVPMRDFNVADPADPFRPYGVTIGHLLEWGRLLLHLHVARGRSSEQGPDLVGAATSLTQAAVRDGWSADGTDGFVYTTDFEGTPVVRERMHWVCAEAMANATMRASLDVDPTAAADHDRWLGFALNHHRDLVGGSWWHELDAQLRPSATVWAGKPDVYHALQALWLPRLVATGRGCVSFAGAASTMA